MRQGLARAPSPLIEVILSGLLICGIADFHRTWSGFLHRNTVHDRTALHNFLTRDCLNTAGVAVLRLTHRARSRQKTTCFVRVEGVCLALLFLVANLLAIIRRCNVVDLPECAIGATDVLVGVELLNVWVFVYFFINEDISDYG